MILNLSGPSGSGKTTLAKMLCREYVSWYSRLVPYTTREPRIGETDGEDYWFISEKVYDNFDAWLLARDSASGKYGVKYHQLSDFKSKFLITTFPPRGVIKLRALGLAVVPMYLNLSVEECRFRMVQRGDAQADIEVRLKKDNVEVSLEYSRLVLPNDKIIILDGSLSPEQLCKVFHETQQHLLA